MLSEIVREQLAMGASKDGETGRKGNMRRGDIWRIGNEVEAIRKILTVWMCALLMAGAFVGLGWQGDEVDSNAIEIDSEEQKIHEHVIQYLSSENIVQISDNAMNDTDPHINNNGQIVWNAEEDIYFWNGADTIRITQDGHQKQLLTINNNGQFAWIQRDIFNNDIYFWDGSHVIRITYDNLYQYYSIDLNNAGHIAWACGSWINSVDCEIYYWNGITTTRVTNDVWCDFPPAINDYDQIVWKRRNNTNNCNDIISYANDEKLILSYGEHAGDMDFGPPSINNNGRMVWVEGTQDWGPMSVYYYNGITKTKLAGSSTSLYENAVINENDEMIWSYWTGSGGDWNSVFWNGTSSSFSPSSITFNDFGTVAWGGSDVYIWDRYETRQLTNTGYMKSGISINNKHQIVWYGMEGSSDYEIYLLNVGPIISNVRVSIITDSSARISWRTVTMADSLITRSINPDLSHNTTIHDRNLVQTHYITLLNLRANQKYYFEVHSKDIDNNLEVDDNNTYYYTFTTLTDVTAPNSWIVQNNYWTNAPSLQIDAVVSDNGNISSVTLWYRNRSNNNTGWSEFQPYSTLFYAPWCWTITFSSETQYEFYSLSDDSIGNMETAPNIADAAYGFDFEKPTFINQSPLQCATGNNYTFAIHANDLLSGLRDAKIQYWLGESLMNAWMVHTFEGVFIYNISIPLNNSNSINYFINVTDKAGNYQNSINTTLIILDNYSPSANAGPDQIIIAGTMVTFNASASTDNIGIANYTWTFTFNGSSITLYGVSPGFNFTMVGNYTMTLTVRDAAGNSDMGTMNVIVNALDSDGDGIPNDEDVFPNDPDEWADSDYDCVGDNSDAFPDDPDEWVDTDGDGIGDNSDAFPNDPDKWEEETDDSGGISDYWWLILILIIVIVTAGLLGLKMAKGKKLDTAKSEEAATEKPVEENFTTEQSTEPPKNE